MQKMVKIDLDAFMGAAPEEENQPANQIFTSNMPDSDRITIIGVFADDSGSILDAGLEKDVVSGVNLCVNALKGAKGADFYLDIRGFGTTFYSSLLKNYSDFGRGYDPRYDSSPLVRQTMRQYEFLRAKAEEYTRQGIPASVAYMIITDGLPNRDVDKSHFKEKVVAGDFIVGIGVQSAGADKVAYKELFSGMGIKKIMTPRASGSEIRRAVNEFSQSVVTGVVRAP